MSIQLDLALAPALQRLALSRDPTAWAQIVEHCGERIHAVGRRIGGSASAADDITQETFLEIRDHAGSFQPRGQHPERAAEAWIMRVATTCALKSLRSQRRRRQREAIAVTGRPASAEHPSEDEASERVRIAMDALPERHRLSLALHYFSGLDYGELADALSTTACAARVRVHRAREYLRRHLDASVDTLVPPTAPVLAAGLRPGAMASWLELLHATRISRLAPAAPFLPGLGGSMAGQGGWVLAGAAAIALAAGILVALNGHRQLPGAGRVARDGPASASQAGSMARLGAEDHRAAAAAAPGTERLAGQGQAPSVATAPAATMAGRPLSLDGYSPLAMIVYHEKALTVFNNLATIEGISILVHDGATLPAIDVDLHACTLAKAMDLICEKADCSWKQTAPSALEVTPHAPPSLPHADN